MAEKTILLADDDAGHVAMFRRAVETSGFACRVEVVEDGAELIDYLFCLGKFKELPLRPRMPELIVLDLKMPKMDGLQVLRVLRRVRSDQRLRFPPIVVLTSSDLDDDVAEAYRWGAQSYLRKPLSFAEFAESVGETLHYWLRLNRPPPSLRLGEQFIHEGV